MDNFLQCACCPSAARVLGVLYDNPAQRSISGKKNSHSIFFWISYQKPLLGISNKDHDLKQGGWSDIYYLSTAGSDVSSLLMCCGQPWVPEQALLANTNWWNHARQRHFTRKTEIHPATDLAGQSADALQLPSERSPLSNSYNHNASLPLIE